MAKKKLIIWCGLIPDIYGYGITVFETTEDLAKKSLKKHFHVAKKANDGEYSFPKAMEWFGGRVFEVEMDKCYDDGIR
jgi:hypothetical protein